MIEESRSENKGDVSLCGKIKQWMGKSGSATIPVGKAMGIFAIVLTVSILLSVLLTFSLTVNRYGDRQSEAEYRLGLLADLIEQEAYFPYDEERLMKSALAGYVGAMNDNYAVYYDEEEFERLYEEMNGVYAGIGVSIRMVEIELEGKNRQAAEIASVTSGGAAEAAGILVGDYILAVVGEKETVSTDGLTSDEIAAMVRGKEGTKVTLSM